MYYDEKYMRRALELAKHGEGNTSPNPMVGAVIVGPSGRIIGEGYHRKCGSVHAEVNAIASVKSVDKPLIKESTLYVTLEPCSHYGKTPPCAKLIIETKIPRVVVGAADPFKEVAGRGIKMLKDAGIEVVEGVLADESRQLNRKFMTAHELGRPFVTLKWAQSKDGFIDAERSDGKAFKFSDEINSMMVHRLRSLHDAILIGSQTALSDNPRLDCRLWPGRSPRPVIVDRRNRVNADTLNASEPLIITDCMDVNSLLKKLYSEGVTSVLVEGGAQLLQSFIDSNLWDEARVEVAPIVLGDKGRTLAPKIDSLPDSEDEIGKNIVFNFRRLKFP